MKNTLIFTITSVFVLLSCQNESNSKINNLKTFAKTYGYIKYFHPSDEASKIDWDKFSAYGAQEIVKCENSGEMVKTLNHLYGSIAPTAVFSNDKNEFDFDSLIPADKENYDLTYWQHRGVSKEMNNPSKAYQSVRVNRYSTSDNSSNFGNLFVKFNPNKYKGKTIKLKAWVKVEKESKGTGHLWVEAKKEDGTVTFVESMNDKPIKGSNWEPFEIVGEINEEASSLGFGCFLSGKGKLFIDDIQLMYKKDNQWIEIPIKNNGFENGEMNQIADWKNEGKGYSFSISDDEYKGGKRCGVIEFIGAKEYKKEMAIFKQEPTPEYLINEKFDDNIYGQIPISLYCNEEYTFPKSEISSELNTGLNSVDENVTNLSVRLGNVINTYAVFQHFYPYFKEMEVDWDSALEVALERCYQDKTAKDHKITLQKFTAKLKDGHIAVSNKANNYFVPPIRWEWIEDKLVITSVNDLGLGLKVGEEVSKINNRPAEAYFEEYRSRISAGTNGWLNHVAQSSTLFGPKDSTIVVEVNNTDFELKRSENYYATRKAIIPSKAMNSTMSENDIIYINLSQVSMKEISDLMPDLENSKGIICDLRGYPKGNHGLISHLLNEPDTSVAWMQIPEMVYPNQEDINNYTTMGWGLPPQKPYLGDKNIVFIIDGRAISYAESYLGFISHYKLATLVGSTTAGTNGNVNSFNLLGDYTVSFTGMKVLKHDGSQHHGVGINPDIKVEKTIDGLKSGKDEFLEKAIQTVLKKS